MQFMKGWNVKVVKYKSMKMIMNAVKISENIAHTHTREHRLIHYVAREAGGTVLLWQQRENHTELMQFDAVSQIQKGNTFT